MDRATYEQLDGYCSSKAILEAIEQIAGDEFDPSHDYSDPAISVTECERIWADPTDEERATVEAIAWTLAHADEDVLHWGETTIRRPA